MTLRNDGRLIVGLETGDDAGVYRLSDTEALVQTVDFITPIVDDPFLFGRIAACNSLSDVYAMGGRPLTALNIVCFPTSKFPLSLLRDILKGGQAVLAESGTQLAGGHSVNDPEMKYGLSVTGIVHPDRVVRNNTLRDGDAIILTKPLGTGVIATAIKAGILEDRFMAPFIESMTTLNRAASEIMLRHGVHACTDVTGFGLVGHLAGMLGTAGLKIEIESSKVPLLPGALEAAKQGLIPGGMYRNRDYTARIWEAGGAVRQEVFDLLHDPQTSGGLLIALPGEKADALLAELTGSGMERASIIARVTKSAESRISVL